MDASFLLSGAACAVLLALLYHRFSRTRLPYPPGPPGKLLTGNWHQLPQVQPWLAYTSWATQYGPLVHMRILNQHMLILNTLPPVLDLLDARSALYSDRPFSTMYHALVGRAMAVFSISSLHPRFRRYRRLLHTGLSPRATSGYASLIEAEARTLGAGLRDRPRDVAAHVRRNAGAVIMKLTYGWTVQGDEDYFVKLIEEAFVVGKKANAMGAWMVDAVPAMRHIPDWFPGAYFKRRAHEFREFLSLTDSAPFEWAKTQLATEKYTESFTSRHLRPEDGHSVDAEEEDAIKWCSAALYVGGADTTVSALTSFFYAMSLYPDVQKRAQAELDALLSSEHRLPRVADLPYLPHTQAIVKEVLRWAPVAPLGLPHCLTDNDTYMDYSIPKGTVVFANIWAIMHDPERYPDPFRFDPERFIPDPSKSAISEQPDPRKFAFGFGRRICPGAHFAETSLQLNIATILTLFDISKPTDDEGREIESEVEWSTGVTTHILNLACDVKLRSPEAAALLAQDD
ncbi:cytochrome P450 [Auriscalpium vulgare]|uniref:Cytochrome P450 n=1 Tax=Auriscalpium vulgare TaxID=40419 RepID=A0ACB8RVS6_9AGAM|nr:cytochrome P450 [Auriscalpium vulgare]